MEEPVIALSCCCDPAASYTEQQKVNPPCVAQLTDEHISFFDCRKISVDPHRGFLEADGIPDSDFGAFEGKGVFSGL